MAFPDSYRHMPLVDASPWREDPSALRSFADEQGYLFFRGMIADAKVEAIREIVQTFWAEAGLVEGGSDPVSARPGAELVGNGYLVHEDPRWVELHRVLYQRDEFWELGSDPTILSALRAVYGHTPRGRCGDICRVMMPRDFGRTTPPHQDLHYVGKPIELWTVWLPLVDCPVELGALAVAPGTHRDGPWPHTDDRGCEPSLTAGEPEWATSDLLVGDALMFHGLTVHGPWHNTTERHVRLSVDYRFVADR